MWPCLRFHIHDLKKRKRKKKVQYKSKSTVDAINPKPSLEKDQAVDSSGTQIKYMIYEECLCCPLYHRSRDA